ncbi:coiled-coil domain-containing protein 25 [Penicillium argentinense]|uniref:Coiled-coil domain-containing protein 25 n=1 Tax=Penicillium argentinense TaxID=1131581 RepID=A0A9W9G4N1_9EURO|nr:coiled-coil domain-containing protein 25 [Penicillium argentinense]KAJ5112104.1 coiled-coil domain-containing protein 25 [Penicillium argentinense]
MVYYFTSNVVSPSAFIYVGKDKFENEDLIKFGLDQDVWLVMIGLVFHVDNLSSAHVYVRLREGETWDNIAEPLLEDCAQLTKANSIEGNKKDNITIIYTPWSNLQKDGSMATGQVSFHNPKLVRKVLVRTRENPIINRLNKTRVEKFPDLRAEKEEALKKKRHDERKFRDQQKEKDKLEKREREQLKWQKEHAYDDMFSEENMLESSNQNRGEDFLDDFM